MNWAMNHWYPVLEATRLGRRPLPIRRVGLDLVLWRDERGEPVATSARCPHRGASLGQGRVVQGCIECPYHGFRFDADGRCRGLPCAADDAKIPAGMHVQPFPIAEAHGLIWLWPGRTDRPLPEVPALTEDLDAERAPSCTFTWHASFERVVEGFLDPHHVEFTHGRSSWHLLGPRIDDIEATLDDDTMHFTGTAHGGRRANYGFEFIARYPAIVRVNIDPKTVLACATPIDEEHTFIVLQYYMHRGGPLARLFAWALMQYESRFVLPEDAELVETIQPFGTGLGTNRMVDADKGVTLWYKLHQRMVQAEREAEAA